MLWRWWPSTPRNRTDADIAGYVAAEVEAGRVSLARAQHLERALRDEADGKVVIMRDPKIKPKMPRRPSYDRR